MEIESIVHQKFNAKQQIDQFVQDKGIVLACGTCIKARNQESGDACPISSMIDGVYMVEWAEKMLTF